MMRYARIDRLIRIAVILLSAGGVALPQAFAQADDQVHITPRSSPLSPHGEVLQSNVNLVLVNVTVVDSEGRLVGNLEANNFSVLEDKQPQQLRFFSREDVPVSLAVVLDTSQSMKPHMADARAAALEFVQRSNPEDEIELITFADRPRLVTSLEQSGPSDDGLRLMSVIPAKGNTALWDSVYLGISKLTQARHRKKAMLVISDGGDNRSRYTQSELASLLKEADVQVYAIDVLGRGPMQKDERTGLLSLDEITSVTGGRTFSVHDPGELQEAIAQISRELRSQYVLGYYPSRSPENGRWRKIKVELKNIPNEKKLHAYAKKGYYGSF